MVRGGLSSTYTYVRKAGMLGMRFNGTRLLYSHTYVRKAGMLGMRFNEGGRDLVESEMVVKRGSTRATYHRTQASQFGIHHPRRMWVPLSHPVMWVPLSIPPCDAGPPIPPCDECVAP